LPGIPIRNLRITNQNNESSLSADRTVKITYFEETDAALLEFSEQPVFETKEINENIYLDLDEDGNLIGMTIEHALPQANINKAGL
jgi:uncharacterized protein YuzE